MPCFERPRGAPWRPARRDRRRPESSSPAGAAALPPLQLFSLPAPAALLALPRAGVPEWRRVRTVALLQPAVRLARDRGWLQWRARKPFAPPRVRDRACPRSPAWATPVLLSRSTVLLRHSVLRLERGRRAPT